MTYSGVGISTSPGTDPGRRFVQGLGNPFPMINYTSSMLADDPIAQMICASLDEVLAPIISVLDCYDSYLDAHIAPIDFVRYMSSWILVNPQASWDDATVRKALAHAIRFYDFRGTSRGLHDYFKDIFGIDVVIEDSGSVITSRDSTDPSTWSAPGPPAVSISLQGNTDSESSLDLIQTLLAVAIPAHVTATLVDGKQ
ncbi:MAG: phage tail protein [Candidatus Nanopelagicales bacterium]|nr:phage tail protein [Candidatus Nanopelagicales bacterium]